MKNLLLYRIICLSLLIIIVSGDALLAQSSQYEHRNYLGWVRDLSTTETPYESWPSIRIDANLTDDYDKTLDFMVARGLNEITLWGLFTAKSWDPVIANTIDADRKALINTWIDKAHSRGIKVLSGMGVFSWGFSKIMDANPSVRCSCNAEAMDPSNADSWIWQNRVVDYVMDNFSFDGISMQSADLGRCSCGEYAKYGDIEYHSIINNKVAAYIKSKNANYIVGISGWGMNFSNASDINFLKTMTTHVDYLIDVEETALRNSRTHRQNIVSAISPCKFGSIGSPNIEPIQVLERDRYFIPTYYRASARLKDLYADGGRACETYFRERGNPGDAVTGDVLGAIESNVGADVSTTAQSVLSGVFSPVDNSALSDLEKLFKDAEDAYFNNAPGNNVEIILLQARATTIPQLPDYLTNMSSDGKTNYDNALRTLYSNATNLLSRVNNKDKMQLVIRCIGRAINDLVAIRGTGSNVTLPQGAWREAPHNVPGKIEAEDFDKGGEGVAYHDNSGGNDGKSYRADAVDIASDPGITVLGYTDSGEWVEYSINTTAGTYDIYLNVASPSGGGSLKITVDGQEQTVSIPSTGGWGTYQRIKVASATVSGGSNKILRLDILAAGFNVDYIDLVGNASPDPSYYVNSGGGATGKFAADGYVSGGNTYIGTSTIDVSGVTNAAPAAVYQSERWGASTYTFPSLVAGKSYTVRLHFAEIYFDAAGKRKFNVDINGTRQLTDFDVFAAAGAKNKAVVKDFTITPNSSNNIVVTFTNGALDNAKISGIEVFPAGSVTPPPSGIVSGSTYEITARHSGKALDVNGGPTATQDGANVQQWTYGGGTNQQWKVEDVGGGYYKLTAKHSGKVLDVSGSGTADGTNVQQWTSNGTDAQKWSITDIGGGYYKVISKVSGKALDVAGGQSATGDGVNVQQWTYGGGTNQQWAFTLISSARMAFEAAEPTANSLNVYPNPSKGIANISYTPLKTEQIGIHLYDTQGKLIRTIFKGSVLKGVVQNYSIDGSSFKEGLYIIRLKTPSNSINKKVIFNK